VTIRKETNPWEDGRAERVINFDLGSFSMKTSIDFQIVCGKCGGLAVKIEDPERASRETIVYCGDCGAPRGTMGGLRDQAVLPEADHVLPPKRRVPKAKSCSELAALQKSHSELVAQHKELQGLRRRVQTAEGRRR
jgi:hypothetical protein